MDREDEEHRQRRVRMFFEAKKSGKFLTHPMISQIFEEEENAQKHQLQERAEVQEIATEKDVELREAQDQFRQTYDNLTQEIVNKEKTIEALQKRIQDLLGEFSKETMLSYNSRQLAEKLQKELHEQTVLLCEIGDSYSKVTEMLANNELAKENERLQEKIKELSKELLDAWKIINATREREKKENA
jgi:hypothetical protein